MTILDRLPISSEHSLTDVHAGVVKLRPYQIIVRVSILNDPEWDPRAPILPAILDTGNNLNFSIQAAHLTRWAGIDPRALKSGGMVREGTRSLTLHAATSGFIATFRAGETSRTYGLFNCSVPDGIAIYPSDGSDYPRLPLLGLRAILKNNLKLIIDGKRKHASLRSPLW